MSSGGRRTAIALGAAGFAIGLTVVVALAITFGGPPPGATVGATPAASSMSEASDQPSVQPTIPEPVIDCRRETTPLPPILSTDPCPSAITAVELAVAPVRLPIKAMVIEPGPLFCGVVWEGIDTPPVCFGPNEIIGQYMHAYVSFVGSDKVAVVMLGLDLPPDLNSAVATRPPWNASVIAVAVPPAGWVMP